ncbi:DUF7024 domain-containing protein [Humidesulfovibrio idahonensis]
MHRVLGLLLAASLLLVLPACSRDDAQQKTSSTGGRGATGASEPSYAATPSEGINFASEGMPGFLASVTGLSAKEPWGRWSDATLAPTVTFTFKEPLPQKFTVVLSALCTKENENIPVKVYAGSVEKSVKLTYAASVHEVSFALQEPTTTLVFIPAKTSSPKALGEGEDVRHLGIGFVKLSIEPR